MIIDIISDLHGYKPALYGGDLLIVAGDLTKRDKPKEHEEFYLWLAEQDYDKKIVIAGNHDNFLVEYPNQFKLNEDGIEYLCDSGTEFCGTDSDGNSRTMKIYGSPWTKTFEGMNPKCKAFTCDTEEELSTKWALIPDNVDILITHSPPYQILDMVNRDVFKLCYPPLPVYECVGSKSLLHELETRIRPKLHAFGHIHECGNMKMIYKRAGCGDENNTICVNASHVNERYQPVNKYVRIIL